jgi:hypothetical protein
MKDGFSSQIVRRSEIPVEQIASYEEESERFEMFDGEIPCYLNKLPVPRNIFPC